MAWGRSPSEFWALHPQEFHWAVEAYQRQQKQANQKGGIDEDEALNMKDELLRLRAKKGIDNGNR